MNNQYQFYETPEWLADYMCVRVINPGKTLEPSAGNGSLIRSYQKLFDNEVDCFEMMPENRDVLLCMNNVNIIGYDFLESNLDGVYDNIIASPPFSNGADIIHINKMYASLASGGRLITTCSSKVSEEKSLFLEWLKQVNAQIEEFNFNAFAEGGSKNKSSYLIIIDKK